MRGTRLVLLATIVVVAFAGLAISQAPERRDPGPPDRQGPPPDGPGGPQFHVLPPFAQRELQLTPEQQKQIEALEAEIQARMQKILTPEQLKTWNEGRGPRGPRADQPRGDQARPDQPRGDQPPSGPNPPRREPGDEPRGPRGRGPDARGPEARGSDTGADGNREPGDGTPRRNGPGRRDGERRDGANRGDQSSSGRRSRGPLERITQQLELTADQQSKVDKLLEAHHEKTRALFRQVQADLVAQMKEVLTEEQFKQFTKALEAGPPGFRRPDRNDNPDRPGGADRPDSAATQPTADAKK